MKICHLKDIWKILFKLWINDAKVTAVELPLHLINGSGTLSGAITLVPLIQCQKCYDFLKETFYENFHHTKITRYIAMVQAYKLWPNEMFDWNTSFDHKSFDIGSTVIKLWLLKDDQLPRRILAKKSMILSVAITWIPWIQFQQFSVSLEGDLSNGVIKVLV